MKEEKAPLILAVILGVVTLLFGALAFVNSRALNPEVATDAPDFKINSLKSKIDALERDAAAKRDDIAKYRQLIAEEHSKYELNAEMTAAYESEFERRKALLKSGENFDTEASQLDASISKLKNDTLTNLNNDTSKAREDMEKNLADKTQAKDASVARLRQVKDEFDRDSKSLRNTRNYTQSALDESKSVLGDLTQREVTHAVNIADPDGKVLLADNVHGTVIIDMGTSQGVQNGFRFEVYAMRPGKVRVTKGFIEVRHASLNQSDCLLIKRAVDLPKDPLSDYVASQPEEMYSPYQESGRKGYSAQTLSGGSRSKSLGVDPNDPIVEGDLVTNPFFSSKKPLTFYIAGSKEMVNERQKSAIRYKWTEIKAVAESYGAKVVPAIDTTVDYIIAQKNAKAEDPEFQKGVDVGIPVIYEWELFRFLDNK